MPSSAYPLDSPCLSLVSAQRTAPRKRGFHVEQDVAAPLLAPQQIPYYEKHIGGTFGQAAHVVGVPGLAEGDVEAHAVALAHQAALHVAADAVEHLEFEAVAGNLPLRDEPAGPPDDGFIVRGSRGINPFLQEIAGQFEVIPVHIGLSWEGDCVGFEVSAFAEADADFGGAQLFDISLAAVQVALNDDAHRAITGVQGMHQIERAIGIIAGFHIDADETAQFGGAADQLVHVGQALLVRKIEADTRPGLAGGLPPPQTGWRTAAPGKRFPSICVAISDGTGRGRNYAPR